MKKLSTTPASEARMHAFFVYPVTNNLVDVFVGEGWEQWTRLFVAKDGSTTHMGGEKLPKWAATQVGRSFRAAESK